MSVFIAGRLLPSMLGLVAGQLLKVTREARTVARSNSLCPDRALGALALGALPQFSLSGQRAPRAPSLHGA